VVWVHVPRSVFPQKTSFFLGFSAICGMFSGSPQAGLSVSVYLLEFAKIAICGPRNAPDFWAGFPLVPVAARASDFGSSKQTKRMASTAPFTDPVRSKSDAG
jgi:hypothetical protein